MIVQALKKTLAFRICLKLLILRKVPEAYNSMNILLEHAKSRSKSNGRVGGTLQKMIKYAKIRSYHIPNQYIVGQWPFREITLKMKPPVLIPRYQTEFMVGMLLERIRSRFKKGSDVSIVEYGCGTGAITLSLIKELKEDFNVSATMVDINPQCIHLSKYNAIKNSLSDRQISYVNGDMQNYLYLMDDHNVIVSNPPYLSEKEHFNLEKQVRLFEAKQALVGGEDGFKFIRMLTHSFTNLIDKGNKIMMLEYGSQPEVKALLNQGQFKVVADQYNKDRFIIST